MILGSRLHGEAKDLADAFGAVTGFGNAAASALLPLLHAVAARTMLPGDAEVVPGAAGKIPAATQSAEAAPVELDSVIEGKSQGHCISQADSETVSPVENLPGGGLSCLLPHMESKDVRRVRGMPWREFELSLTEWHWFGCLHVTMSCSHINICILGSP